MRFRSVLLLFAVCTVAPAAESAGSAAEESRKGSEALRAHDYEVAATAFTRAAEIEPEQAEHWLNLGRARSALQQWEPAIEAYGKALELEPAAKTYNNLANVYFRRGDYESAAGYYGRAVEADPDYLLAAFHHGWCLRELQRPEEAEAAFSHCMEIAPRNDRERQTRVDCLFGFGSTRHRAGDYEAAARAMEQVVTVHPGHLEARYYLGMAYRQLGRMDDARAQLEIHSRIMKENRKEPPIEKLDPE